MIRGRIPASLGDETGGLRTASTGVEPAADQPPGLRPLCQASLAFFRRSISAIWRSMLAMNAARCASVRVSAERAPR
jgi:hypothetical protein